MLILFRLKYFWREPCMLRLNKRRILPFPSKTVLEDCLTRPSGTYSDDAYSPFRGMDHLLDEQFKPSSADSDVKSVFLMSEYLAYSERQDVNPAVIRGNSDTPGENFLEGEKGVYRFLEDLMDREDTVEKYVRETIIGYKINSKSNYKESTFVQYHKSMYDAESGEFNDKRDSITIDTDCDVELIYNIRRDLSFMLKELHQHSTRLRVHLFSFLRAYYCILKNAPDNSKRISPNDFDGYTLFRLNSRGDIDREFSHRRDNNNEQYRYGRMLVCGFYNKEDEHVYKLCQTIMSHYVALGIDMTNENPAKYTKEFVNSIVISHLPTNEEYISQYANIDNELSAALQPYVLVTAVRTLEQQTDEEVIENTETEIYSLMSDYLSTLRVYNGTDNWVDRTEEVIHVFNLLFNIWEGKYGEPDATVFERDSFSTQGGLIYNLDNVFVFPALPFGAYENDLYANVYGTIDGYFIVKSSSFDERKYVTLEQAYDMIDYYVNNGHGYSDWRTL